MKFDFSLDYLGVTGVIEHVRETAGRDATKLAELSRELVEYLREAAPETPELALFAHGVLDGYLNLANHGFFPEVYSGDEDL